MKFQVKVPKQHRLIYRAQGRIQQCGEGEHALEGRLADLQMRIFDLRSQAVAVAVKRLRDREGACADLMYSVNFRVVLPEVCEGGMEYLKQQVRRQSSDALRAWAREQKVTALELGTEVLPELSLSGTPGVELESVTLIQVYPLAEAGDRSSFQAALAALEEQRPMADYLAKNPEMVPFWKLTQAKALHDEGVPVQVQI